MSDSCKSGIVYEQQHYEASPLIEPKQQQSCRHHQVQTESL